MYTARAYSAASATSPLASATIPRRDLTELDGRLEILFCGICHSDLHSVRDEWSEFNATNYPIVPGHEILGRVTQVGSAVRQYQPGDLAAVGCLVDSDGMCESCKAGLEQFCPNQVLTFSGPDRHLGGVTYGGYSDSVEYRGYPGNAGDARLLRDARHHRGRRGHSYPEGKRSLRAAARVGREVPLRHRHGLTQGGVADSAKGREVAAASLPASTRHPRRLHLARADVDHCDLAVPNATDQLAGADRLHRLALLEQRPSSTIVQQMISTPHCRRSRLRSVMIPAGSWTRPARRVLLQPRCRQHARGARGAHGPEPAVLLGVHGRDAARRRHRVSFSARGDADTAFHAIYGPAGAASPPAEGSLEYFLTERYCLYHLDHRGRPYRLEIHHPPWPLQPAHAQLHQNTMARASGLRLPHEAPLLHFVSRQDMVAWAPSGVP